MPNFDDCERVVLERWTNFHATCVIEAPAHRVEQLRPKIGPADDRRRLGAAISAIVADCVAQEVPLRAMGSRWSLSNIVRPSARVLETSELSVVRVLPDSVARGSYAEHVASGEGRAAYVEAGTVIRRLNDALGKERLAIRTSGAADGHRIAGLIATGTHGSNLEVGCLHDTVEAIHLMVAPGRALLLMPAERRRPNDAPFDDSLAKELGERIGVPTERVADDELFACALVSLGSCGIVLGVVLDVAPLYQLDGRVEGFAPDDAGIQTLVETLDPTKLDPTRRGDPYHLAMVMLPYAKHRDGFFVTTLHASPTTKPFVPGDPALSMVSSDSSACLASVVEELRQTPLHLILPPLITALAAQNYGERQIPGLLPGQVFGATRLPPGNGRSTELVVDHRDAWRAISAMRAAILEERARNRFLLGAPGIRFVPKTKATLGMNIRPMNCFIELPTIAADFTDALFTRVWNALDSEGIAYGFHWGQEHRLTPPRAEKWYGGRLAAWKSARARLLDPAARRVFAAPILFEAGLA